MEENPYKAPVDGCTMRKRRMRPMTRAAVLYIAALLGAAIITSALAFFGEMLEKLIIGSG